MAYYWLCFPPAQLWRNPCGEPNNGEKRRNEKVRKRQLEPRTKRGFWYRVRNCLFGLMLLREMEDSVDGYEARFSTDFDMDGEIEI
mmetsp:Transcript_88422/g.172933  ORF Transcript_88422/g.172933 Transcript_88422/m.172933 type:complete len:86 (+) Transcript_88422:2402-2659(+)